MSCETVPQTPKVTVDNMRALETHVEIRMMCTTAKIMNVHVQYIHVHADPPNSLATLVHSVVPMRAIICASADRSSEALKKG